MEKKLTFKELRKYISLIDRISICHKETLEYQNYNNITEVPKDYDDYFVYGIGLIESEFYKDEYGVLHTNGNTDKLCIVPCIEIMIFK